MPILSIPIGKITFMAIMNCPGATIDNMMACSIKLVTITTVGTISNTTTRVHASHNIRSEMANSLLFIVNTYPSNEERLEATLQECHPKYY